MNKTATKERMTEQESIIAMKNGWQPFGNNCWVRLNDSALYDDSEVIIWLWTRKLI